MVVTLFITLMFAYIYGEYLKTKSIKSLSKSDAKQTSMLVFESLYSAMEKGWTKEDLKKIIQRLNNVNEDLKINVYRSKVVSDKFGIIQNDENIIKSNKDVAKAIKGEEILNILDNDHIEYFYPIIAKQNCLACHTNANIKDILGVITVAYPVVDLKVSLNDMINFFVIFIVVFSIFLFLVLFIEFDTYLLKPIKNFVSTINNISSSHDITKRIELDNNVEEINSMQIVFNNMLDSIEFQFYNDNLTKLPNRKKLLEILDKKEGYVFLIINIDNFQGINDLYGNSEGDVVLKEFALFLKTKIPKECKLFRLHADEFGMLFSKNFDLEFFDKFTEILIEDASHTRFDLDNGKKGIFLNCTIGISHGDHSLLINADIALKLAKKRKKDHLVYDPSMQLEHEYEQNLKWTKRIKDAIKNDKIISLFQPIVDCKTQKIVKYESLMRMVDDNGEYISPAFFLDLAKKNKLYHELTKIILNKTFNIFEKLPYMVSINLSVDDILDNEIVSLIKTRLSKSDIGKKIVFEIIESEGIENFEKVVKFIDEVKEFGCEISIDDFGTGYSNFEYLMKLKVDYIKIDSSMIKNIDSNKESEIITETIVAFAKKLNIKTIGEFVYSKSVFDKVVDVGVDYAQGYYFGEPTVLDN
ncbi:MAG: EAL domain-containing protein [Arcobacteraceae bacterium]|nr:EAL domain-containing protein [Arcobacteraceae bacterium]